MVKDKRVSAQTELTTPHKNFSVGTPVTKMGIFDHPSKGHITFPDVNSIKLILEIARKNIESAKIFLKKMNDPLIDVTTRMDQVDQAKSIEGKNFIHTKGHILEKIFMLNADEKEHFDFFENCIVGITFCFTALECFANLTIPDDYVYQYKEKVPLWGLKFLKIRKKINLHRDDKKLDLNTKLGIILPKIFNVETPKGKSLWGEYKKMEKLRNSIIHFKKVNLTKVKCEEFNESLYAKLLLGEFINAYDTTIELIEYYYQNTEKPNWLD
jgi:hypothetical protein